MAREAAAAFLAAHHGRSAPALWVRVNSLASGLMHDDVARVMPAGPAGIVLPKPDSVDDVWALDETLDRIEREKGVARDAGGKTAILAIATETALAVLGARGLREIAGAAAGAHLGRRRSGRRARRGQATATRRASSASPTAWCAASA